MTEKELKQLETWLSTPLFKGKAMSLDRLHGYLCAAISGPEVIPPSVWLPDALGGEPEYESLDQAREFMALLMAFYNDVAVSLLNNGAFKPLLKPLASSEQRLDYQTWCEGYILGWALSTQEWLQPGNEALKKLTFPILYLSGAFQEEAQRQGKENEPDAEELKLRQECADILPESVTAIYNFWLSRRKPAPLRHEQPKVGRNDLCPCGSGRKFKQCCGSNRTLH